MSGLWTRFRRAENGFTLVELLVVIAILAILVAVVVPNFTGLIGKGELQTYNAEKKTVQTVVDAYFADNRASKFAGTETKTIPHNTITTAVWITGETSNIGTYFRQATKWCWLVANNGLVSNSQDAVACGSAPPVAPS
ncbi:MAG: prepilin-type N-terminal cleavage/methylation domain-containing protein [Chloroflexi bacterium]|nr:prepilin-type N-terminal cleavage/methylation domain-containing protein [Chloroflexota bacterium]